MILADWIEYRMWHSHVRTQVPYSSGHFWSFNIDWEQRPVINTKAFPIRYATAEKTKRIANQFCFQLRQILQSRTLFTPCTGFLSSVTLVLGTVRASRELWTKVGSEYRLSVPHYLWKHHPSAPQVLFGRLRTVSSIYPTKQLTAILHTIWMVLYPYKVYTPNTPKV